jgi:hypothetical protein
LLAIAEKLIRMRLLTLEEWNGRCTLIYNPHLNLSDWAEDFLLASAKLPLYASV